MYKTLCMRKMEEKFRHSKTTRVLCFVVLLFVLWIGLYLTNYSITVVRFVPRDHTCKRHDCNKHGTCLIGKCFCWPGYEGDDCEINLNKSTAMSCLDPICFIHPIYGIGEVPLERWQKAVSAERNLWISWGGSDDRWHDHLAGFDNYKMLPNDLGDMIEMGCGPYTQALSILRLKGKQANISKLTLWDPNAHEYMKKVMHCSYKNGTLKGFEYIPTTIIAASSEEMHSYVNHFDTILMINVLEHVQNAYQILQNTYNALRPNGTLIFGERWWDYLFVNGKYRTDVMHPIHIKYVVWKWFTDQFVPLYDARNHNSYLKYGNNGSYFIGRKKVKS